MFDGVIGTEIVITFVASGEKPIISEVKVVACIHPKGIKNIKAVSVWGVQPTEMNQNNSYWV